ncbi:MAG: DNA polymerase III subunit gamma/tau [bacterium]|nr:DNA polymerase III subunit gamma/tau [bacterium]
MSKLALYRKYRPRKFEEVLGQNHITDILENAVKLDRISHAYLFSGPRGTGKTSVARILAKEAGCSVVDLMEIDAASSRGIDEIRALREGVRFSPMQGSVKVYIIDEVHMLTKEAFNALLKTLEEPPKHAIFILATTEPEKVPGTIISRCQNFSFKKIPHKILAEAMVSSAKKEGFEIDKEAAGLIALFSDGSFRDALGMLDQILSIGDKDADKKISGKEARDFLSVPPREMVENFILAMVKKEAGKGLETIREAVERNLDAKIFLKLILRAVRTMLLLRLAPDMKKELSETLGEAEFEFLEKNKDIPAPGELERALKILLDSYEERARPYLPYLPLELALIKICSAKKQ